MILRDIVILEEAVVGFCKYILYRVISSPLEAAVHNLLKRLLCG